MGDGKVGATLARSKKPGGGGGGTGSTTCQAVGSGGSHCLPSYCALMEYPRVNPSCGALMVCPPPIPHAQAYRSYPNGVPIDLPSTSRGGLA